MTSPLAGAWVVNTRSSKQAGELDALLEERGARSLPYPCIDIAPVADPAPLDDALERAVEGAFGWLVFTSANAVEMVETRLRERGIEPEQLAPACVAAVGPGTAAAVSERLGIGVELCPDEHRGEALAEELVARGARSVLVPQAEQAREALVHVLVENGVEVETVTAYRTVVGSGGIDVPRLVGNGRVDAVVFASPSAVDNMALRFERENGDWEDLRKICVACIGPATAEAAGRRGLDRRVSPLNHTLADMVNALERFYRHSRRNGKSGQTGDQT